MKKIHQKDPDESARYLRCCFLGGRKTAGDTFHILQIRAPSFDQAKV